MLPVLCFNRAEAGLEAVDAAGLALGRGGEQRLVPLPALDVPQVHSADVADVEWRDAAEEERAQERRHERYARRLFVHLWEAAVEAEDLRAGEALRNQSN